MIQFLQKFDFGNCSKIFLIQQRHNLAYSGLQACPTDNLPHNTIIASIQDSREMIEFEDMSTVLRYQLPITYLKLLLGLERDYVVILLL